jgi:hypothetical protein
MMSTSGAAGADLVEVAHARIAVTPTSSAIAVAA